jgi:hypothetical protein
MVHRTGLAHRREEGGGIIGRMTAASGILTVAGKACRPARAPERKTCSSLMTKTSATNGSLRSIVAAVRQARDSKCHLAAVVKGAPMRTIVYERARCFGALSG